MRTFETFVVEGCSAKIDRLPMCDRNGAAAGGGYD
jgi:hypothetical protein